MCFRVCISFHFSVRKAFELAYSDVRNAFREFLRRTALEAKEAGEAAPRPFILASHSQGGHHLIRLLEEEVEAESLHDVETHGDVFGRCICVYIVGSKIPTDKLDPSVGLRRFRMARSATDHSGCMVAYDSCTEARGVVTHPQVGKQSVDTQFLCCFGYSCGCGLCSSSLCCLAFVVAQHFL